MQEHRVFQLGGRLQSVRDFLREYPAQMKAFQQIDLLMSSVAVALHRATVPRETQSPDTYFVARILLGILQRGHSSFVSPFVEHSLLDRQICGASVFTEETVNRQLNTGSDQEGLADRLVARLLSPEPGVEYHSLAATDSQTEVIFLRDHLPRLLGQAVALVEPQRPLTTMLEDGRSREEFTGQRVDFALQTPSGTKIVFEIDGEAFHTAAAGVNDGRRDHALRESGWIVQRISARDVLRGQVTFDSQVRDAVARDRAITLLNRLGEPRVVSPDAGEQESWLVLAPHAVARVQFGILLGMIEGQLSLDDVGWRIGVVERDVPAAEIAVIDLHRQLSHLCALYELAAPPDIDLLIARTHGVRPLPVPWTPGVSSQRVSKQAMVDLGADVVIDVSVCTRPTDLRLNDPLPPASFGATPVYEVRTAYRRIPEEPLPWPTPRAIADVRTHEEELTFFLQLLFRKPSFYPKQLDIIARALQRRDVLGLLPTGGGKSLTFQLPTFLSPGVTIVVAPLKSLIDDQVDNLHRAGINRVVGIHSGQSKEQKRQSLDLIAQGHPRFLYIAPERFHIQAFREEIQASMLTRSVSFVVVDEAHCVSEWGHQFRPSYLSVAHQARRLFRQEEDAVPILALTATASDTVLVDIQRELDFDLEDEETLVSIESFDRKELKFLPLVVEADRKQEAIKTALAQAAAKLGMTPDELTSEPKNAGVVFCRYVNGAFGVWGVRGALCAQTRSDEETIRVYAGSRPKYFQGPQTWDDYKQRVQRDFKDDRFPLLVATSSFGMGIDKRNIRFTLHYGIPPSIEDLAQEAGRAGRDRGDAACAIIFTQREPLEKTRYLDPQLPVSELEDALKAAPWAERDDAHRVLFLHHGSYPGVERELRQLRSVFEQLRQRWGGSGPDGTRTVVVIPRGSDDKETEKAVYRLGVLGAVDDYTVDYTLKQVTVYSTSVSPEAMEARLGAYVARYDTSERVARVLETARSRRSTDAPYDHVLGAMCEFIYDVIERSRREALRNVVERLERTQGDGKALAREIEIYLSRNVFTAAVAGMVGQIDVDAWFDILARATNSDLARRLVATNQRQLESYPTHPGLHLLVGMGMLRQAQVSPEIAASHIQTAFQTYTHQHGASDEALVALVKRVLRANRDDLDPRTSDAVISRLIVSARSDLITRVAYPFASSPELRRRCAVPWLRKITQDSRAIRRAAMETVA